MEYLCSDLHLCIIWHQILRNLHTVDDLNASVNYGIVLHIRHADKIVNFRDTKPMEWIRHERLESSVLYTRHAFCAVEIVLCGVPTLLTLTSVVNEVLCHLSKTAPLFPEVNHDTTSSTLCSLDAFFNRVGEVGTTCANIRSEHITSITLIMNTTGQLDILVGNGIRISPNVDSKSPNGRQEDFDVGASDELWIHAICHAEDGLPQESFGTPESSRHLGQIPYGFNGTLGTDGLSTGHQNLAIWLQPPRCYSLSALGEINVGFGHCNRGSNVKALI
mmetsp:Transcript_111/g.135  ORF Transcript_111/g.135 Transcript_111/m.135 type:complete len:276 (-) Transcript_111:476-1303(-)